MLLSKGFLVGLVAALLSILDYEKLPGSVSVQLADSGFTGIAWANRFWNSPERFSHVKFGGYLVMRLDGYTEADAKAITTLTPSRHLGGGRGAWQPLSWDLCGSGLEKAVTFRTLMAGSAAGAVNDNASGERQGASASCLS